MISGDALSVHMYPFKSMEAATVDGAVPTQLDVGQTGFRAYQVLDRQWSLELGGAFISQRGWAPDSKKMTYETHRKLATVAVDIMPDHVLVTAPGKYGGKLELSTAYPEGPTDTMTVHKRELTVFDESEEPAQFFRNFLERPDDPIHLKRADILNPSPVKKAFWRKGASNAVLAGDGAPMLLANQGTLDYILAKAGKAPGSVRISRYRANIVARLEPFSEDLMRRIQIGAFIADVVGPCKRCPIPDIDQETGISDGASRRLLAPYSGVCDVPGIEPDNGNYFGENLNHQWSDGQTVTVMRGTILTVTKTAAKPNVRRLARQTGV